MNELSLISTEVKDMTPAQLGGEIRLLTGQARRMALSYGIQIGYRLKVAHDKVGPHGWGDWLKAETDFSAAAASRFEKLYEGYGKDQGSLFGVENNFPTLEKISISNALQLLTVPAEEREQVAAELDAEHLSARELEKALAERDEARKALEDAQRAIRESPLQAENEELRRKLHDAVETAESITADAERLTEERNNLFNKVKELENKPVEVAVERDEEAIKQAAAEARKAAEDAAKAELDRLRDKLNKAQKAQKDAEEKAKRSFADAQDDSEKAKAEAEKARQEAEELRRKLRTAESGAGEVAMLARMAQTNFASAMDKIEAMKGAHADVAEKMLTGMERIVEALSERIREVRGC